MDPAALPLRDIHLPAPVSWWPPAPGWWALAALLLGAALLALWLRARARRPVPLRASALSALGALEREWQADRDDARLVREVSALLRRVSLSLHPRARTASLTGEHWLGFLDSVLGDTAFSQGPGRVLADGPYRRAPEVEGAQLLALARRWIERAAQPSASPGRRR